MKATVLLAVGLGLSILGQTELPEGEREQVSVDALRCWRDVERRAVRVGEPFGMSVTCAVVETDRATTVPNEASLAPETIDLSPFEVVSGERYPDVRDGVWRFLQYRYSLRVIAEGVFGEDVEIPELVVSYHIQRRLEGGAALPGRELRYVLPAESVRILSLVPLDADDIRGPRVATFGALDRRRFRANLTLLAAAAVGVLAFGCFVAAVVRVRHEWRGAPAADRPVPDRAVVRGVLHELTRIRGESQKDGWDDARAARALAALRLAGGAALSRPFAEAAIRRGEAGRQGQLTVGHGLVRPRRSAVSSAVTPEVVAREIDRLTTNGGPARRLARLRDLHDALQLFTRTRYRPNGQIPSTRLTEALNKGIAVTRDLRLRTRAPVRQLSGVIDTARRWWTR